jgi:hypothetical protein
MQVLVVPLWGALHVCLVQLNPLLLRWFLGVLLCRLGLQGRGSLWGAAVLAAAVPAAAVVLTAAAAVGPAAVVLAVVVLAVV